MEWKVFCCSVIELTLFVELFYIGIPVVRMAGRAYGHVITKISRMGRLPHFLGCGATLSRGAPL